MSNRQSFRDIIPPEVREYLRTHTGLEYVKAIQNGLFTVEFHTTLRAEFEEVSSGYILILAEPRIEEVGNSFSLAHGGYAFSIADGAAGFAVTSLLPENQANAARRVRNFEWYKPITHEDVFVQAVGVSYLERCEESDRILSHAKVLSQDSEVIAEGTFEQQVIDL